MVPENLNDNQNAHQNKESAEMLENESDFLNHVITGDESWFFKYDTKLKRQSEEWLMPQSPRHKKAHMSK
jgi:hypothetical protein